jgi:DNA-binding NarL/FixJ family response regulator
MDSQRDVIRVVVVDDHAAVRIGLKAVIAAEPGLACVGAAADGGEMEAVLYRTRPDAVLLDYHLPHLNGLQLCRRIKAQPFAPAVLLYTAYADLGLLLPAVVAGADGMVHKGAPARELLSAIRAVAASETRFPPLIAGVLEDAAAAVDATDRPLLRLLVDGVPRREIASRLGLPAARLDEGTERILERLSVPIPRATPGPGSLTLMPAPSASPRRTEDGGC